MYPTKPTLIVKLQGRGATHTTAEGKLEVFMQRQGYSGTLLWGASREDGCSIHLTRNMPTDGDQIEICFYDPTEGRNRISKKVLFHAKPSRQQQAVGAIVAANPVAAAELVIAEFMGKPVSIRKETMAYMYDNCTNDTILSPLVYCPVSDTIRTIPENYCLAAFDQGKFEGLRTDIDKAAAPLLPFLEKARNLGFHECDFKKGEDYCKRRLAWLAGSYIGEAAIRRGEEIRVGLLTSKMTWPHVPADLKAA